MPAVILLCYNSAALQSSLNVFKPKSHTVDGTSKGHDIKKYIKSMNQDLDVKTLARIIHECRREAAETKARRGFSQMRTTQAYLRSVEETEREKPRRARGSAAVVGIHE